MDNIDFIKTYFTEEKIESLFFITLGIISTTLAFFFIFIIKYSFYKGFAYPILIVGIIQLIVGTTVSMRSPKDLIRVNKTIKFEPQKIQTEELPRMEKVMSNFTIYKWIEIILIVASIILLIVYYSSQQTFWKGLALGLLIQTSIMLSLDGLAERRSQIYIEKLHEISKL